MRAESDLFTPSGQGFQGGPRHSAPEGRQKVAHGVSRGNKAKTNPEAPEGRKRPLPPGRFCRPSGQRREGFFCGNGRIQPASAGSSFATSFSWWKPGTANSLAGFSRLAQPRPPRITARKPAEAGWPGLGQTNHPLKRVAKEDPAEAGWNPSGVPRPIHQNRSQRCREGRKTVAHGVSRG